MQRPGNSPTFLLDECLSYRVAEMLKEVGCSVTSVRAEGLMGIRDSELIPLLSERGMVWVTKDDAARTRHSGAIEQSRISVVWIRGVQRTSGTTQGKVINNKQLLHMLIAKIDDMGSMVRKARGPRYFLLSMSGGRPKLEHFTDIRDVGKRLAKGKRR